MATTLTTTMTRRMNTALSSPSLFPLLPPSRLLLLLLRRICLQRIAPHLIRMGNLSKRTTRLSGGPLSHSLRGLARFLLRIRIANWAIDRSAHLRQRPRSMSKVFSLSAAMPIGPVAPDDPESGHPLGTPPMQVVMRVTTGQSCFTFISLSTTRRTQPSPPRESPLPPLRPTAVSLPLLPVATPAASLLQRPSLLRLPQAQVHLPE